MINALIGEYARGRWRLPNSVNRWWLAPVVGRKFLKCTRQVAADNSVFFVLILSISSMYHPAIILSVCLYILAASTLCDKMKITDR